MSIRERKETLEQNTLSPFACLSTHSKGRQRHLAECKVRTCFERDIDRIVHSKSFRRMMHKTQVFLNPEGDHYRTRMTHTIEVSRIAKTIAAALNLNADLTEAIAVGHDLGHTPFGHAGEHVLNQIMPKGFHHNAQSLRVIDRLENGGEGLNLSHEVRNGIVCHTGEQEPVTLEGQIVRISDRIAYINHDIDDALRGKIIYPMDIPIEVSQCLGYTHGERINTLVVDVIESSEGKDHIMQSENIGNMMDALRDFMFEKVYRNPVAKGEELKAQGMIERIFEFYEKDPDAMPEDFQEIRHTEGVDRAICDYISGMTDNYAVEVYRRLFIPASWAVK